LIKEPTTRARLRKARAQFPREPESNVNIQEVKRTLCGPMIPVVTHFNDDLSVDYDAFKQNVGYLVDHGIKNGSGVLLVCGAGGDFPMLTLQERKDVAAAIVEVAADRVPILVGVQDTNPDVCLELAKFAENIDAYGIQLSPPYYYHPSDDDVIRWFRSVHDATSRVAIMLYNTWWHGYSMSFDVIRRLCDLERVVSLKWSTADGGYTYSKGASLFAERLAVVDNKGLQVLNHMLGGTGYITHFATIWPEHDIALWEMMNAGDFKGALAGFRKVNWPWLDFRHKIGARTGGEANVVKAALDLCGRPGGPSRPPTRALNEEEREELQGLLRRIGVPA